jgi:16S rRNA (guanine527-N7)-methyltransferase
MEPARIAELLQPFIVDDCHSERSEESAILSSTQLSHISTYIDILLRWNARINLTAIRSPEEIVTRHFGESLFAARHLFPSTVWVTGDSPVSAERSLKASANDQRLTTNDQPYLVDLGSGAGFPGLPIKIWASGIHLALIESNQRKAVFLREVSRVLTLTDVDVFAGRAEDFPAAQADVVSLRAVERFDAALPLAVRLAKNQGHLALLISHAQLDLVGQLAPKVQWSLPIQIPPSLNRILLIGTSQP